MQVLASLRTCGSLLQGSDALQHALQFTAPLQRRHVAAASNALLADEDTRNLRSKEYRKHVNMSDRKFRPHRCSTHYVRRRVIEVQTFQTSQYLVETEISLCLPVLL